MTRYTVRVEPLTVVHIGTGEEFGPMDYTIRDQVYYRFRPESIIAGLSDTDRESFDNLLDKGNIREIALFLHRHVNRKNAMYSVPATASLVARFKAKRTDLNNQLLVHSAYRSLSDGIPIIPGSSIKGAIRTAILDDIASAIPPLKRERKAEQKVLGHHDAKNDPFRALKVSDCPISGNNCQAVTEFVNYKNKRKEGPDFSKMQIFSEIITGKLAGGDALGWLSLQIDKPLLEAPNPKNGPNFFPPTSKSLTLKKLISACNNFYLNNLEKEIEKFYRLSSHKEMKAMAEKLNHLADEILNGENQCLIRVGRFSQVENVTLNEPHRNPKTNKGYGNTRTITDTFLPAGWVKLTFLSEEEAREQQAAQRQEMEKKRQEAERIRLEKEEQAALEKAEAERIANMPADEKMLLKIEKLEKDTSKIGELVHECFATDMPKQVFIALKEKLESLEEWKPAGSKQRKQKLAKRNAQIEGKING